MVFFVKNNYKIYGIDRDSEAVKMAKILCRSLNKDYETENIQPFAIEDNPFPDGFFDAVICINVLHSATGRREFFNLFSELTRLLNSGGLLFLSMKSNIGLTNQSSEFKDWDNHQKNGVKDFYFSEDLAEEILSQEIWAEVEPVKTILLDDTKSYSYLLLKKNA